jgi:hypothetical protein
MENMRKIGPRAYSVTLLHSKTNQTGVARPDSEKPVLDEAADALSAWIHRSGVISGPSSDASAAATKSASRWRRPQCATSCDIALRWRACPMTTPRTRCARASSPKPRARTSR